MLIKKTTAFYSIFIGILNVIMWTSLILADQVPDLEKNIIIFSFHWTSEFIMAGLSLLAGYLILNQHKFSQIVYYFATGMLVIAINGAIVHYSIVEFEPVIIIISTIISIITAILAIKNYVDMHDVFFFIMGVIIYTEINHLGRSLQTMVIVSIFYEILTLILVVSLLALNIKNTVYRIVQQERAA